MTTLDREPTASPETASTEPAGPTGPAWPALHALPTGPRTAVSAAVVKRLWQAAVPRLGVEPGELVIHRPEEFYARVGRHGLIGFGEAYMTGAWDAEELGGVLTKFAGRMGELVPDWLQSLRAVYDARPPRHHHTSEENTRELISHHYDLSNELFATFLDETMSYSSALFEHPGQPLAEAQAAKIERLLDACAVGEGSTVLEIGTGWGELAIRAARRGARVRSITLSVEQQQLARERIAAAGLSDRVDVELCDYRAATGSYDAVVSVEMIEAVGHDYWPAYFQTLDRLLAPGGRVGLQAITMPHGRMLATRNTFTWINKYIFPGGFLPSLEAIDEVTAEHTSLRRVSRLSFGLDYAETLRQWDTRFLAATDQVLGLGFDETFVRMWHFYLEYCRAGFASGYLDVHQVVFARA